MLTVVRAAPYLTVQDLGRRGFRESGVPPGGAMDSFALAAANIIVGNSSAAAGLEWALGGGSLRFERETSFALGGAAAEATLNGAPVPPLTAVHAAAGSVLEVGRFSVGRFLYVGVGGGIDVPALLGSRSTYLPAHFGGLEGRLLRTGDTLPIGQSDARVAAGSSAPPDLGLDYSRRRIRVVPGPQWALFSEKARASFFTQSYKIAHTSNRMGYRLEGSSLPAPAGVLPSEAVCPGTIQVPPNGLPIVLMADSPTVGGYPKIGVVASGDLPVLAQLAPGETFQFEETSVADAQKKARRVAVSLFTLASLVEKA